MVSTPPPSSLEEVQNEAEVKEEESLRECEAGGRG